jgi:putative FmdB family regulatory protein
MPIYEYRCAGCGQTLEKIQRLSDPPLTRCPHCSGRLEKLFSVAAFQLKGGGWYSDGYTGKPGAKGEGGNASAGEGGKDGGGKDTKADPKTDPKAGPEKKAAAGGCGSGCGCH